MDGTHLCQGDGRMPFIPFPDFLDSKSRFGSISGFEGSGGAEEDRDGRTLVVDGEEGEGR